MPRSAHAPERKSSGAWEHALLRLIAAPPDRRCPDEMLDGAACDFGSLDLGDHVSDRMAHGLPSIVVAREMNAGPATRGCGFDSQREKISFIFREGGCQGHCRRRRNCRVPRWVRRMGRRWEEDLYIWVGSYRPLGPVGVFRIPAGDPGVVHCNC